MGRPGLDPGTLGLKVAGDLDGTGAEMGRHLVGSPQRTPGQRVGWGCLQGFEERRCFDGKAVGGTGSNRFIAHGGQARQEIVQGYPNRPCGNSFDRVTTTAAGEEPASSLYRSS